MAYVTPESRAAGYVVPNTVWNQDVVDNIIDTHDRLDDCVQAQPARAKNTVYTNGTNIRMVAIAVELTGGSQIAGMAYCDNIDGETTIVGIFLALPGAGLTLTATITFVVPPAYKYKLGDGGSSSVTIARWTEWDLH